jgi:hypothetical protein
MIELRTTSIKYVNKCNDGKSASMWYSESFLGFSGLSSIFDDLTRLLAMPRVSVQGVKSLGGHFACLCRGFEFYEVKTKKFCYYFSKRKWKYFYTFCHFYSEKSSKRAK